MILSILDKCSSKVHTCFQHFAVRINSFKNFYFISTKSFILELTLDILKLMMNIKKILRRTKRWFFENFYKRGSSFLIIARGHLKKMFWKPCSRCYYMQNFLILFNIKTEKTVLPIRRYKIQRLFSTRRRKKGN